jgi:hypothetical protein
MLPQDPVELKVKELLAKGEKTEAIKFFKENSGMSFQESKSFVESLENVKPSSSQNFQNQTTISTETKSIQESPSNLIVNDFIQINKNLLPAKKIDILRKQLLTISPSKLNNLNTIRMKEPDQLLFASFSIIGIDRFQLNDVFGGICKITLLSITLILIWLIDIDGSLNYQVEPETVAIINSLKSILLATSFVFISYDVFTAFSRTKNFNYRNIVKQLT